LKYQVDKMPGLQKHWVDKLASWHIGSWHNGPAPKQIYIQLCGDFIK